jgi:phage shock protein E
MYRFMTAVVLFAVVATAAAEIPNQLIDYPAFQDNVTKVGVLREQRRITEGDFIRMAADPQTVVLDARSSEKFALLHVKGAKNLSFPDMTAEDLARIIPSRTSRILIYCNNNFLNAPKAFPSKNLSAALNIHTFNVLFAYGYTNVYELGPLIDIHESRLAFEGTLATRD